jgi:hypothetical protein
LIAPIFISFSSKDQKTAETICDALQWRGHACWISCRNIGPGENFQEAIVKAIRAARLMILVFSSNANNSDEIKKEVALAGRHRVAVVPVRVEDVLPGDAFAYEFATRQWVDLFGDWERNIERLSSQIQNLLSQERPAGDRVATQTPSRPMPKPVARQRAALPLVLIAAVAIGGAGGAYLYLHGSSAGKFDGAWTTRMDCPKTQSADLLALEFVTLVKGSHLHGQNGQEGKPASLTLDGDVAADGNVQINAHGLTGDPARNQNNIPAGVPFGYQIPVKLDAAKGAASIHLPLGRPCDFTFVKK